MTRRVVVLGLAGLAALSVASTAAAQASAPAPSAAKKELVARALKGQQADIETVARSIVEQPAIQMMREAGMHIQRNVAPDKREATGRAVEAEVKKYAEEAYPILRDRALKIAPSTIGTVLENKMSEDELRQLVTWLESPANKKFQQLSAEWRNTFVQQLLTEAPALLQPKLVALDGRVRAVLGVPPANASASASAAAPAPRASGK
jgi:hypothetical protein